MRKSSTFISTLFLIHIFTTSVLGPLRIYFFFNIGNSHFVTKQSNIVENIQVCKFYIVTSGLHLMFSIFINTGMIFCRFIYVRYAKGLLSIGPKLFHVLLMYLLIGTYFLIFLSMFPIQNFFLLEDVELNNIQKRICTKTNITWFKDVEQNKQFSLKPKLLIIAGSTIFFTWTCFFNTSAHRQTKRYTIPKTRRNLMTMKYQCKYLTILLLVLVSDQILFMVFQMFFEDIGVDNVFILWWIFHFLEIFCLHIVLNVLIHLNPIRNVEEFHGYDPNRYHGQEKPRQAIIRPRRSSHSITNQLYSQVDISDDEEESNILTCDYCIFNNVQPVYVSPNYYDLLNHTQEDHKLSTAWGPVVIQ